MAKKLAALIACGIVFGSTASAAPISDARLKDLLKSNLSEAQTLETLRSRDRQILEDLGTALAAKYAELLAGSEMIFSRLVEDGVVYYRLDFVNLKNRDRSRALCEILELEKCISLGETGQLTLLDVRGDRDIPALGVLAELEPFNYELQDPEPRVYNPDARKIEADMRAVLDPLGVFPKPRPDTIGAGSMAVEREAEVQSDATAVGDAIQADEAADLVQTAGPLRRPGSVAQMALRTGPDTAGPVSRSAALGEWFGEPDQIAIPRPEARPFFEPSRVAEVEKASVSVFPKPRPVVLSADTEITIPAPRSREEADLASVVMDDAPASPAAFGIDVIEYYDDIAEMDAPETGISVDTAPPAFAERAPTSMSAPAPLHPASSDAASFSMPEPAQPAPQVTIEIAAGMASPVAESSPRLASAFSDDSPARVMPQANDRSIDTASLPSIDLTVPTPRPGVAPEIMKTMIAGGFFDAAPLDGPVADAAPAMVPASQSAPGAAFARLPGFDGKSFLEVAATDTEGFLAQAMGGNRGLVVQPGGKSVQSDASPLALSLPGIGKVDTAKLKSAMQAKSAPPPAPEAKTARPNATESGSEDLAHRAAQFFDKVAAPSIPAVQSEVAPARSAPPALVTATAPDALFSFDVPRPEISLSYHHVPSVVPGDRDAAMARVEIFRAEEERRQFVAWLDSLPPHETATPLTRDLETLTEAIAIAEAARVEEARAVAAAEAARQAAEAEALRVAQAKAAAEAEARRVAEAKAAAEAEALRIAEKKAEAEAEARRVAEAARAEEERLAAEAAAKAAEELRLAEMKAAEEQRLADIKAAEEAEALRLAELEEARQAEEARIAEAEAARAEAQRLAGIARAAEARETALQQAARAPGAMLVSEVSVEYAPSRAEIMEISPIMPEAGTGLMVDRVARIDTETARAALRDNDRIATAPHSSMLGMVSFDDRFATPSYIDFSGGSDAGRLQKLPLPRPDMSALVSRTALTAGARPGIAEGLTGTVDIAQVPARALPGKSETQTGAPEAAPSPLDALLQLKSDESEGPQPIAEEEAPFAPAEDIDKPFSPADIFGTRADAPEGGMTADAPLQPPADVVEDMAPEEAAKAVDAPLAQPTPRPKPAAARTEDRANRDRVLDVLGQISKGTGSFNSESIPARPNLAPAGRSTVQPAPQAEPSYASVAPTMVPQTQPQVRPQPAPTEPIYTERSATAAPSWTERAPLGAQGGYAVTPGEQVARDLEAARASAYPMMQQPSRAVSERSATAYNAADLRIELSYVMGREEVAGRVQQLKSYFPPIMLAKGRFYGNPSAVPGRIVVGIEASDYEARDALIWYLDQNRIPWTIR